MRSSLLGALMLPMVAAMGAVELPDVAFCMSGSVRSLPTVPVLRGLKRNVLQNIGYSASLFAALSYDTSSPQPVEYNASLLRRLSTTLVVRRALAHLRPELRRVVIYNTTEALKHFKPCHAADAAGMGTAVAALYGVQQCFSLVRTHEIDRGDKFDFIVRLRPDTLFVRPLPRELGRNISSWPRDRVLAPDGDAISDFAVVPSGPVAAIYFRTYTAATSCLFRNRNGASEAESLPSTLPVALQCADRAPYEGLAPCVMRANLAYHGLPTPRTSRRPGLIARVCNCLNLVP